MPLGSKKSWVFYLQEPHITPRGICKKGKYNFPKMVIIFLDRFLNESKTCRYMTCLRSLNCLTSN